MKSARALWVFLFSICATADAWWPQQKVPDQLILVANAESGKARLPGEALIQSVAGLAAKSVNEGNANDLVWVDTGRPDIELWLRMWRTNFPAVRISARRDVWQLIDEMAANDLVKGYILYRADTSAGEVNDYRKGMDLSLNVASAAGILDGIIVSEELEEKAKARGLKLLLDARGKTQAWCFETYKERFARRMLCAQDPRKPHTRDLAIAHRTFTMFAEPALMARALEWLEPLSPILGWNGGDEFETTALSSRFGHFQTATDWCMNLPVLMAGSDQWTLPRDTPLSPAAIDWKDQRSTIAFVQTDGDNVQWLQGNFFLHPSYWANPARGSIPFGWSVCFTHLAQLCPPAIHYAFATRKPTDSLIEWGGGYYYPDLFASSRGNRWDLLAEHARRTWTHMKRTNTRVIGFNVAKHDSPETRKALEVFAAQCDGLLGILLFQYAPYEAGAGARFTVKDSRGQKIPVVTARYSIWENSNNRARAGTPAKIAREIRASGPNRHDWAIAHVWSYFKKSPGSDENAENIPQANGDRNGERGYSPAVWCAERLPNDIRKVSIEEMLLRARGQ